MKDVKENELKGREEKTNQRFGRMNTSQWWSTGRKSSRKQAKREKGGIWVKVVDDTQKNEQAHASAVIDGTDHNPSLDLSQIAVRAGRKF
jgi:hypothetical protein